MANSCPYRVFYQEFCRINCLLDLYRRISLVVCGLAFIFCFSFLYNVQYKTGIEIVPFFPIDDSGFEVYNQELLNQVEISQSARKQPSSGNILCWVMTASIFHKTRVRAVNETWLNRCDAGHFFTNNGRFLDEHVPYHTVFKDLPTSYYKLFWKTRLALLYVYQNVSSEFNWYMKADDDTYVVVDNLRNYLANLDPNLPYFIGYRLKRRTNTGYNAGGSGYAISRAAMKIYAEKIFDSKELCPYHEWEDYAVARCLASMNIFPHDSRDEQGRQRFLPWRPEEHYHGDLTPSFQMDPVTVTGGAIFHDGLISMHHLNPDEIRLIDGLLYSVARGIYTGAPVHSQLLTTTEDTFTENSIVPPTTTDKNVTL